MNKNKILLVDDDPDIREIISFNLIKEGYNVEIAENGVQGVEMSLKFKPDIIILDVMMPDMDGMEACESIRSNPETKDILIAFLSARGEDYSQVAGFDAGADDYITKPIRPKVLISRIKALLRRNSKSNDLKLDVIQFDDLKIDRVKYQVFKGESLIEMPRKEFELIYMLASVPGKVFTRDAMMNKIWGSEVIVGGRTIDVHIAKIREKIGDKMIKTIKGVGYKMGE